MTHLFKLFPYAFYVGNHSGDVPVIVTAAIICVRRVVGRVGTLVVVVFPFEYLLKLV